MDIFWDNNTLAFLYSDNHILVNSKVSLLMEKSDYCHWFLHCFVSGGSLAKVAYMSEVRTIRKRHYSFSSLSSLAKSDDEDQEKVVWID